MSASPNSGILAPLAANSVHVVGRICSPGKTRLPTTDKSQPVSRRLAMRFPSTVKRRNTAHFAVDNCPFTPDSGSDTATACSVLTILTTGVGAAGKLFPAGAASIARSVDDGVVVAGGIKALMRLGWVHSLEK